MRAPNYEGASCIGVNTEMFFPIENARKYEAEDFLIQICEGCIVLEACREYALHVNEQGFWGGLTEMQRKAIQKERGIIPLQLNNDIRVLLPSHERAERRRERELLQQEGTA